MGEGVSTKGTWIQRFIFSLSVPIMFPIVPKPCEVVAMLQRHDPGRLILVGRSGSGDVFVVFSVDNGQKGLILSSIDQPAQIRIAIGQAVFAAGFDDSDADTLFADCEAAGWHEPLGEKGA